MKDNILWKLTGWAGILFVAFGIAYYAYEKYLDSLVYTKYFCLRYSPQRYKSDGHIAFSSFMVADIGTYDNDSAAVQYLRTTCSQDKASAERQLRKDIEKYSAEIKGTDKVEDVGNQYIVDALKDRLDSVTKTECFLIRITYDRKFKIENFQVSLKQSEDDVYSKFNDIESIYDLQTTDSTSLPYFRYYKVM